MLKLKIRSALKNFHMFESEVETELTSVLKIGCEKLRASNRHDC